MSDERFDRLEGMMSQLITMFGTMQNNMTEMQNSMNAMQNVQKVHGQKFDAIELKLDQMGQKNDERHNEVMNQFKRLEIDRDFIWEKAVHNERELEIMKRTFES